MKHLKSDLVNIHDCTELNELHNIILQFIEKNKAECISANLEQWYANNQAFVNSIELLIPTEICNEYYKRNEVYSCDEYILYIHVMKPANSTVIHGHGINEVFIINLNSNIKYVEYRAKTLENKWVELIETHKATFKTGVVYEKSYNDDLIHRVYNDSASYVKFMEIYIKPHNSLPIYLSLYGEKNGLVLRYEITDGYFLNQNLFQQKRLNISKCLQFSNHEDLLDFIQKNVSIDNFILLKNDSVIVNVEQARKYLKNFESKKTISLYITNENKYLLE